MAAIEGGLSGRALASAGSSAPVDNATPGLASEESTKAARVRTGVVLAAGRSARLSAITHGRSKALLPMVGMPLIERSVRSLLALGLERVLVVVGYDGQAVASAAVVDPRVEIVTAAEWKAGNGSSLAAAAPQLFGEELVLVVCGDHVFSEGSLAELVRSTAPAALVDVAPSPEAWAEGTRVRASDGTARAFSKSLPDPWIDAGAFVVSADVFSCYRKRAADGDHSLAGTVSELAARVPMRLMPLPAGSWWQDVDTAVDLGAARSLLRRSLGKPSDGVISRRVNRPVSSRITMALSPLRLPPALISAVAFAIGIWAAWSLSGGRALLGGLLVQAASILDGVDGETARLLGVASSHGALIDALGDRMVDAAIVAGLWLWAWDNPSPALRITAIGCSAVGWGVVAIAVRDPVSVFDIPKGSQPALWAAFGGRDARMLLLALGSLAHLPAVALVVAMTTLAGSSISRVAVVLGSPDLRASAHAQAADSLKRVGRTVATAGRMLLLPVVLGVVFFGVLPRLADLHQALAIVRSLPWRSDLALVLLACWNLVTYWPTLVVAMPGLSVRQAAIVGQTSTAVAMTVPAGGAIAVGVSYAMYSSWGFLPAQVAGSALATFLANMSFKLLLPAVSLVLLFLAGERTMGLVLAARFGVTAVLATVGVVAGLLRSEELARRAGDRAGRLASWLRRLMGRPPVASWGNRLARVRLQVVALLRQRWLPLALAELVSQLSVFVVLLASIRTLGISNQDVSWEQTLAVFAFVRLGSAFPIVPGNVGLAELGYIGGLALAGGNRSEVVAAVLLFRLLTYFAQVPIGGLTYLLWRRGLVRGHLLAAGPPGLWWWTGFGGRSDPRVDKLE